MLFNDECLRSFFTTNFFFQEIPASSDIFVLGVIFFVYGLISLFETVNKRNLADFLASETVTPAPVLLFADVEWSVATPGVYKLKQGSIIQTAMVLAARFRVMQRDYVCKKVNLASKLTDGKNIFFQNWR